MPFPVVPALLAVAFGAASVIAVAAFWQKILSLAQDSLFPWVQKKAPSLENAARLALVWLDKGFSPLHVQALDAWNKLRTFLLSLVQTFEKNTNSEWVCKTTQYFRELLKDRDQAVYKKVVEEKNVDFSDLPESIREQLILKKQAEFDVVKAREQEMENVRTMVMDQATA